MELETKIQKLKDICSRYETNEFLTFLAGVLLQIPTREENPFLKKLLSPMRQLFFLGLLNLHRRPIENKKGFNEEEWDEIATLLHEIEMEYFYLIGFPNKGKESKEEIEKIKVTMPTFMNYYFNGPLTYQEQEIERIENVFKGFEGIFINKWNLKISDFILFYDLVNEELNLNLNRATKFLNPDVWQVFTSKCVEKGLLDPQTWIAEAPEEIEAFLKFSQNPGSILLLELEKINYSKLPKKKFKQIIDLFTCQEEPNDKIVYYTEENQLLKKPFIKISDIEYLSFSAKQYLDACYSLLFETSLYVNRDKTLKARDKFIESKTANIFKRLFGKEAFFYINYSIDGNESEQDILILYKGNALVIEVKASGYRAPMRDAHKAFDKLKSDFKKSIQYGYEQTSRVANAFKINRKVTITGAGGEVLYELNSQRYENIYSVIVTLERFGHIQTNLSDMLVIADEDEFPWSVNIDDLEAFILTLSKRKNKIHSFLTFLSYRRNYHGHLICSDELELCGLFLKTEKEFRDKSLSKETILTLPDLTEPIEKAYIDGLGFENERHLKEKKNKTIGFLYHKK